MTEQELYEYIQKNAFIPRDEWAIILQNEEHDTMIDYDQMSEPWTGKPSLSLSSIS